jgi:hypothetical protein
MIEQDGPTGESPAVVAPSGMPLLSAGAHRRPTEGACVMEYVSVLAGARWSDHPRCTDPALAELARRVNDDVGAASRPALAALAPRLVGAVGRRALPDVVILAVARTGLELAPEDTVLLRTRRLALARIERASADRQRTGLLEWGRIPGAVLLGNAYAHLGRVLRERPRPERDAVRIRALAAAIEDVRHHVGAPEDGRPGVVAARPAQQASSGSSR